MCVFVCMESYNVGNFVPGNKKIRGSREGHYFQCSEEKQQECV